MDWSNPGSAITTSLSGSVLAVLGSTTTPLTGLEVHRRAGRGSSVGISQALERLAAQGVVLVQPAGRANLYRLNRAHLAAPVAEILAGMRSEFLSRLRATVGGWAIPAVAAALFGSVARGQATTESDVDVLVVRSDATADDDPTWSDQISELERSVLAWSGNRAAILDVTIVDLTDLVHRDAPVLAALRADAIDVGPRRIRTLLTGGSR
jgi:predicted nucleotidyltransferase